MLLFEWLWFYKINIRLSFKAFGSANIGTALSASFFFYLKKDR